MKGKDQNELREQSHLKEAENANGKTYKKHPQCLHRGKRNTTCMKQEEDTINKGTIGEQKRALGNYNSKNENSGVGLRQRNGMQERKP